MLTREEIKNKWIEVTHRHRNGDVISSVDMAVELVRWVEEINDSSASEQALNDICVILKAPDWEYPGQVVRDVAQAIGMSLEDMATALKTAEENKKNGK